jgi:DNA uptake protein and related DNA-binding proteins
MGFWRSFFKEWFSFSRSERQGVIILIVLIGIVAITVQLVPERRVEKVDPNIQEFAELLSQRLEQDAATNSKRVRESSQYTSFNHNTPLQLHNFDPNVVSEEELVQMGLPERFTKSILAYRAHGGKYRFKEDVQKLYGLSTELFQCMEPYIALPTKEAYSLLPKNQRVTIDSLNGMKGRVVELNSADSASLVGLRGIGPASARRILLYRKRLGGFYSIDQLTDIYGIKKETLDYLKGSLVLDASLITYINLNEIAVDTLATHPYVSLYQARAIGYYREKRGAIHTLEELVQNRILSEQVALKIRPYVRF